LALVGLINPRARILVFLARRLMVAVMGRMERLVRRMVVRVAVVAVPVLGNTGYLLKLTKLSAVLPQQVTATEAVTQTKVGLGVKTKPVGVGLVPLQSSVCREQV